MRLIRNSNIVPLWEKGIKTKSHGLLEVVFDLAFSFKEFVEDRSKDS